MSSASPDALRHGPRPPKQGHPKLVWVRNPDLLQLNESEYEDDPLWVPGQLTDWRDPMQVTAVTQLPPPTMLAGPASAFPPRGGADLSVHDIADMEHVNEASIASLLITRFNKDCMYTRAGPRILLSINPRQPLTIEL